MVVSLGTPEVVNDPKTLDTLTSRDCRPSKHLFKCQILGQSPIKLRNFINFPCCIQITHSLVPLQCSGVLFSIDNKNKLHKILISLITGTTAQRGDYGCPKLNCSTTSQIRLQNGE